MSSEPPPYGPPPYGPPPYQPPAHQPPPYPPSGFGPPPFEPQPAQAPRTQRQRSQGILGWITSAALAVWAFVKVGGLALLKFGAVKTVLTLLISFGFYAWGFGPVFALGLVLMILVHELGHVFEIRRQGMQATAPLFIPFFGAAIFQRQHATDALKQAQIGIAGPIGGTIGATVAWALYGATGYRWLWLWAVLGLALNLFNLIPVGMLDGGWILAPVSKWFQVAGFAVLIAGVVFFGLWHSPIVLLILVLGVPVIYERFKNDGSAYYQSVPQAARWGIGAAWLGLVLYLVVALDQLTGFLNRLLG